MTTDSDWMSWAEAAALVGCPVPTIDWHSRQGRIERRPFCGQRPTLKRSSVEVFAVWWTDRQAQRARRRAQPRQRPRPGTSGVRTRERTPAPTGWLSSREVAAEIGMSATHVRWLVDHGQLTGVLGGDRLWVEPSSVRKFKVERARWISSVKAGEIAGCSPATVMTAAQRGEITQRKLGKQYASMDRSSVIGWAEHRTAAEAAAQLRREERRRERDLAGRPDLEHDWLNHTAAAVVLGLSRNRVAQLANADRLPFTAVGPRRWFRRDHMELVAAARRFPERFS